MNSKGFMITLQETFIIYYSMNVPKIEFITYSYIYFLYYQCINFQLSPNLTDFWKFWIKSDITEGFE